MNNEKQELSYIGFKFACLEIRSRNEEAINSTRNRVYSLNSSEMHHICQDGINAEKFEKTRMRFNIDVFAIPAIVIFKALYIIMNMTLWPTGNSYDRRRKFKVS